jgi:hypothetical protein
VVAFTGNSRVNIARGFATVELKQDRATAVDRDLSERLAIEEILSHQTKGSLDRFSVK